MEEIKKILHRGIIVSLVILGYGVLFQNRYVYIGMFLGAILSVIGFYMIYLDAKTSLVSDSPFKISVIGYLKRYVMYGFFLGVMTKYYGFPMLVGGVIGLFNVKINIFILTLFNSIKKIKKNKNKY